jgi:hypothetical protein
MAIIQTGSDHIAVVVDGSNHSVTISRAEARLTLLQRHRRRREPRKDLDLLDPYARAVELVGRSEDLEALNRWLASDRLIAVRCVTGRAGCGKTRLAVELCEKAESQGWLAGFATHDELTRFQGQQHLAAWRWPRPTLIVVDYAAASARVLRAWLEQLAEHQENGGRKLRLLLLERHADAEAGWWAELSRFGGFGTAGLEDLLDPQAPVPLPSLRTLEERRRVLAAVMAAASRLNGIEPALQPPALDADPWFQAKLGDPGNTEPLYLMMAGLTAVQARVPHMLQLGRLDLARRIAEAEVERIGRLATGRGLDGGFLQHLAACVTLTDGVAEDELEAVVIEEQQALHLPAVDPGALARAVTDALPNRAPEGIDAIRPDLIGEAAVMTVFQRARRSVRQQAETVERAWRRAPARTAVTVVRSAQDYAEGSHEHPTLVWLDRLTEASAQDLPGLLTIAAALPPDSVSLRERAAAVQVRIVDGLRAQLTDDTLPDLATALNNLGAPLSALGRPEAALDAAQEAVAIRRELAAARPDAFRPGLAGALTNLGNFLSDLGRPEAALDAAQEAADLYRTLAAARPDAFRPNLAVSLMVLSDCLEAQGRPKEALAANREAIEALAEPFLRLPAAYEHWMLPMVQQYLQRCEAQGCEPDGELLEPVVAVLIPMIERGDSEQEQGDGR